MNIKNSLAELIGSTPLLRLHRLEENEGIDAALIAKLEACNPLGSVKDRAAWAMIEDAERSGALRPGGTIVEPTSGNTGIGLAFVCAIKGYQLILTMPESMSAERRMLLAAFGAHIELTPAARGMQGAIDAAHRLRREHDAYMPMQFENPANPRCHYESTGPEIWWDTDGSVDVLVCTVGTGGTLTGTARYLKEQNPAVRVVGVEPAGSAVLSGGEPGPHKIQGLGAGFVPKALDLSVMDEVLAVSDEDAYERTRQLAATEGLLVGISSGAAVHAALILARRAEYAGKTIVALLPDTGERYLSSGVFKA